MNNSTLRLVRQGGHSIVMDGDVPLMHFISGDLYMAGQFLIQDVRFHPRGPSRIWGCKPFWQGVIPGASPQGATVTGEATVRGLVVRVRPEGTGPIDVDNTFEFLPDPRTGGWMIDHVCRLTFRRAVAANTLGFCRMDNPRGEPTLYWEFDDPLPVNAVGPSVPMAQDWIGQYEPTVGPDTFRKHWRPGLDRHVFQEPGGRVRTIRFHRAVTSALTQYNRRAVAHKAGGFAGWLHADGAGVVCEYRDGKPAFGHLCEWGNNVHYWQAVAGDPDRLVMRKGQVLERRYRMREVPAADMKRLLARARPVEPTAGEWKRVECVPLYEEPVNRFQTSWRHDPTGCAYAWVPGMGATWDRKTGRKTPGSLKLVSTGHAFSDLVGTRVATWQSPPVGPSTWMNPLAPKARYRFSGYVRVRPGRPCFHPPWPSLSITFHQYGGPATYSPQIRPSPAAGGGAAWKPDQWVPIEAVSGPVSGNVMSVTLGCHLRGEGEAWFDEMRFERV